MLLEINATNPDQRKILQVVEILKAGGVIIYPTDTVYALGCDITNQKAIAKICQLRGLDPAKAMLTFICKDFSQLSDYTMPIDNQIFRLLKKHLPGPFTFVFKANNSVPKLLKNKKNTVGIRIPGNPIVRALVEELGRPLLTTSLKSDDEILEYFTDPEDIYQDFGKQVDVVIDGGICGNVPSTLVDCTTGEPVVIRYGAGEFVE
ncbi:MAG: threonylcarbamoyl-AMP synthase [Saprospiraceae bacterium]|jgi:tRNA threonylcarbamoyl adenosine modification protein (Sua5/YciO/YrdC/YwlC family)|nr:threonylcarbamoyl-AMP synthase [Saprospiraceae bacterium]